VNKLAIYNTQAMKLHFTDIFFWHNQW